ncbi:hypothetical protein BC829DRAFT_424016 [Chytridium lagenaria]|nr:hypothetical protein BC829DRAFT_424016 [Chytridium lagenaria]
MPSELKRKKAHTSQSSGKKLKLDLDVVQGISGGGRHASVPIVHKLPPKPVPIAKSDAGMLKQQKSKPASLPKQSEEPQELSKRKQESDKAKKRRKRHKSLKVADDTGNMVSSLTLPSETARSQPEDNNADYAVSLPQPKKKIVVEAAQKKKQADLPNSVSEGDQLTQRKGSVDLTELKEREKLGKKSKKDRNVKQNDGSQALQDEEKPTKISSKKEPNTLRKEGGGSKGPKKRRNEEVRDLTRSVIEDEESAKLREKEVAELNGREKVAKRSKKRKNEDFELIDDAQLVPKKKKKLVQSLEKGEPAESPGGENVEKLLTRKGSTDNSVGAKKVKKRGNQEESDTTRAVADGKERVQSERGKEVADLIAQEKVGKAAKKNENQKRSGWRVVEPNGRVKRDAVAKKRENFKEGTKGEKSKQSGGDKEDLDRREVLDDVREISSDIQSESPKRITDSPATKPTSKKRKRPEKRKKMAKFESPEPPTFQKSPESTPNKENLPALSNAAPKNSRQDLMKKKNNSSKRYPGSCCGRFHHSSPTVGNYAIDEAVEPEAPADDELAQKWHRVSIEDCFKKGIFSTYERVQVDKAVKAYLQENGMSESDIPLMFKSKETRGKGDKGNVGGFFLSIHSMAGINRTVSQISFYVKRHYGKPRHLMGIPWSKEEDLLLKQLVHLHGHKWTTIMHEMGRIDCYEHYQYLMLKEDKNVKFGRWTKEEENKLVEYMQEHFNGGHNSIGDFEDAARFIGTRTAKQCYRKFGTEFRKRFLSNTKKRGWEKEDSRKLLEWYGTSFTNWK